MGHSREADSDPQPPLDLELAQTLPALTAESTDKLLSSCLSIGAVELLPRKYGKINRAHYLCALVHSQEAEWGPMPRMRWSLSWKEVKGQLQEEVTELLR